MPFPRSSGILLHPTSFPSRFGIGDLGSEAYRFIDFLAKSAQQLWQILPLGPVGHGNSPYMSYAAMAGNPLLISPELLRDDGLLSDTAFTNLPEFPTDRVDFERVIPFKMSLLQQAFETFQLNPSPSQQAFEKFCQSQSHWLNDYAFFMAFKESQGGRSWHTWDSAIANRHPEAIQQWEVKLELEINYHKFLQFEFFQQWSALKLYANQYGVQIIGDIPIYVAYDSVDVWAHPEYYYLDRVTAEPELIAGVPPDYFSPTGQLWGNPVYRWRRLQKDNFQWWIQRIETTLSTVDIVRLDHFRGFESFWMVEQGESNAIRGGWMKAPGEELFTVLQEKLGQLPIIAEDLGVITPEVEELRDAFEFPGMKVLQFAFGEGRDDSFFPSNYPDENCVVYTGTHDNDTTVGWFEKFPEDLQQDILIGLEQLSEEVAQLRQDGVEWAFIWLAMQSIANQSVFPLQDILGLDSEARMNVPGEADGNWGWRCPVGVLTDDISDRLRTLTESCDRAPRPES
jgi:4-alpha-glucanotransferase